MIQQELDVLLKFVRLSSSLTSLPEYIEDEQEYQTWLREEQEATR